MYHTIVRIDCTLEKNVHVEYCNRKLISGIWKHQFIDSNNNLCIQLSVYVLLLVILSTFVDRVAETSTIMELAPMNVPKNASTIRLPTSLTPILMPKCLLVNCA